MKFMLVISFIIHIVLLYAVYILFQQIQSLKNKQQNDIDELLNDFLAEIKRENEKLERSIIKQKQQHNPSDHPATQEAKQTETITRKKSTPSTSELDHIEQLINKREMVDEVETSTESKVFQMHQEGKTVEEIAKTLKRGKTEVMLMLKLYEK